MLLAKLLLPLALVALVGNPLEAGAGTARHKDAPRGGGGGCRGLERNVRALEGPGLGGAMRKRALGALGHGLRRRALELARRRYVDRCVHVNEIQVLGSHNSYHVEPRPMLLQTLVDFVSPDFLAWEYTHPPLGEQFASLGIRQIELDVFADPDGGLYADRQALVVLGEDPASGLPELDQPGMKVLHVQDLDFETTCTTLVGCLLDVKAWSDANPRHLPLVVLVEVKDEEIPDPFALGFSVPVFFGPHEFRALEAEIRSVFAPSRLLVPDDVRGGHASLEEAVLDSGWPTLGDARGRVLFALDNGGKRLDYLDGDPSLAGRVLFPNSVPGEPDAAFVKLNDPIAAADLIPDLVRAGYVVRTRADADTQEARSGDTTRRDAALASGAQWVSTDYAVADPAFGTDYAVEIPGPGIARCNPHNAPAACRSGALEGAR